MRLSAAGAHQAWCPAPGFGSQPLLAARDISIHFGGIIALDRVSFDLAQGHILGLIGPNGAGKTTLFNCLTRLYTPNAGAIEFEGRSILDQSADRIAALGIARTFQNLALFRTMSVFDNVRVGGHSRSRSDFLSDALHLPWIRREEKSLEQTARELIDYLQLNNVADKCVADLPFGTQKRVELARALAARPRLLLLDEPAGGLNHNEVGDLGDLIRRIRDDSDHRAAGRTPHESCDVDFRPRGRARLWPEDRRRHAGRIAKGSEVIRAYLGSSSR